jgi:hypothetical protein
MEPEPATKKQQQPEEQKVKTRTLQRQGCSTRQVTQTVLGHFHAFSSILWITK